MERGSLSYEVSNLSSPFTSFCNDEDGERVSILLCLQSPLSLLFFLFLILSAGGVGFSLQSLQSPLSPPLFLFVTMRAGTEGGWSFLFMKSPIFASFYPLSFYNEIRERDSKVLSLYIHILSFSFTWK